MNKRNKGLENSIRAMMHEVEAVAKDVRAAMRKRAKEVGLTQNLRKAAKQLREGAAKAAAQVEKYAHGLRMELEGKAAASSRKRAARR
jgi:hypothetical protein